MIVGKAALKWCVLWKALTLFDISHVCSEAVAEEGDGESEQSQMKESKDGTVDMVYLSIFGLAEVS